MINAVNEVTRKNAESYLEPTHINKILHAFACPNEAPGFSKLVDNGEIISKNADLTISLYLYNPVFEKAYRSTGDVVNEWQQLHHQLLSEISRLAKQFNLVITCSGHEQIHIANSDECISIKLGDVAEEAKQTWKRDTKDVPVVGLEHIVPEELVLTNWDINPSENTFTKKFEKGQILLGRRRAYQKKAALAPIDGICSGDITVIQAKADKMIAFESELLPFIIQNERFFDYAVRGSAGSLSPRVKWEHLKDYEFSIPSSMDAQKRLANMMWAAYRLKEAYKRLLSATDEMVKSQFIEMFGKDNASLTTIGECANTFIDGDWIESKDQSESGIRLIQTGNVGNGVFKDKEEKSRFISEETFNRLHCSQIFEGDILVSRLPDPIGRACIVPQIDKAITAVDCTIIRLKPFIMSEFFIAYTQTTTYQNQIKKATTGTTRRRISRANLAKIKIPLPTMEQQMEFAAIVRQADKSKFELKKAIEAIDQVIKSLING